MHGVYILKINLDYVYHNLLLKVCELNKKGDTMGIIMLGSDNDTCLYEDYLEEDQPECFVEIGIKLESVFDIYSPLPNEKLTTQYVDNEGECSITLIYP